MKPAHRITWADVAMATVMGLAIAAGLVYGHPFGSALRAWLHL